jgi:uncharacterized protein with ATP-grasp and redox domains
MKIKPQCIPCLIHRSLYETELENSSLADKVVQEVCDIFAKNYSKDICSATLATKIHNRVYKILNTNDPYSKIKKKSNELVIKLLPKIKKIIKNSKEKLGASIRCSIVGNILDFGLIDTAKGPESFINDFEIMYNEGLKHNDIPKIKKFLKKDSRIVFFADNCGEIIIDKLLCQELKKYGVNIVLVVKGKPILTDATIEDAEAINILDVVDNVMTTGSGAVGVDFSKISKRLKKELENADLIISKGMANYEAFSETDYRPIVHLMRTKCNVVAKSVGAGKNWNIVKLYE